MIGALIALAPAIVRGVEIFFANKPKSGSEKKSAAVAALHALADKGVSNGLDDKMPSDAELGGIVEAVFQGLQKDGKIVERAASESYYLVRGHISKCDLP